MSKHTVTAADLIEGVGGDCFYTGPLEPAQRAIRQYAQVSVEREAGRMHVLLGTTHAQDAPVTWETLDSWGTGPDEETAWRYAIGAEFGPVDSEFQPFQID